MSELQNAKRRIKAIRAIRHSTELEGSRSTDATRVDQLAYARGTITAAELCDRVRRPHNVDNGPGVPPVDSGDCERKL